MTVLNEGLFAEIESQKWAMEPDAFYAFVREIQARSEKPELFAKAEPPKISRKNGVAQIPIRGPLMSKVPGLIRFFGIEATEYGEIRDMIESAVKDKSIHTISLSIDSPGGTVAGSLEAAKAIYEAKTTKATHSVIHGMGASSAYLLASQAERIYADSPNSMIGSIGVMMPVIDSSKAAEMSGVTVHVIKSGEIKGAGIPGAKISEKQLAAAQELVDGMAANMIDAIARGRGKTPAEIKELATGQVWLADKATSLGLCDEVRPNNEIPISERARAMDEKEVQAKVDAACAQATSEALTKEKTRAAEIAKAFPDDPAFALSQIQSGIGLLEAKAAYADILSDRMKKMQAEKAAESKAVEPAKPAGAAPVQFGEPAVGEKNFQQMVHDVQAEHKCSWSEAARIVNRDNPGLYEKSHKPKK